MFPADNNFKSFQLRNQSGQGIIEIVVVLGLAAILILSLVALSVRSNRSANFSRAEDQAARFAQEGMEYIRNMRDYNTATITLASCSPSTAWTCIFDEDFSGDKSAELTSSTSLDFDSGLVEEVLAGGRTFERRVTVRDDGTDNPCNPSGVDSDKIKQFTVEVSWTDTSGPHASTTNSCLTK